MPALAGGRPDVAARAGRAQLAVGLAGIGLSALPLRRGRLGRREARAFRAVNTLPEWLFPPTWVVMQLGNFVAVPAAATVAWSAGRPRLAVRLLAAGSASWALAKVAKRVARRGRPASFLSGIHHRGKEARGLGYLSGHTGVSMALVATALPHVGRRARPVVASLVPLVGLARVYVGAHLPLDVAGGAALGLFVSGALGLSDSSRYASAGTGGAAGTGVAGLPISSLTTPPAAIPSAAPPTMSRGRWAPTYTRPSQTHDARTTATQRAGRLSHGQATTSRAATTAAWPDTNPSPLPAAP